MAFRELTQEIAKRNEATQAVARKIRTAKEKEDAARRREWERL